MKQVLSQDGSIAAMTKFKCFSKVKRCIYDIEGKEINSLKDRFGLC